MKLIHSVRKDNEVNKEIRERIQKDTFKWKKIENEKSYSVKTSLPSELMLLFSISKSSLSFKRLDDTKAHGDKNEPVSQKHPQ